MDEEELLRRLRRPASRWLWRVAWMLTAFAAVLNLVNALNVVKSFAMLHNFSQNVRHRLFDQREHALEPGVKEQRLVVHEQDLRMLLKNAMQFVSSSSQLARAALSGIL
jgi:hypothetical protein